MRIDTTLRILTQVTLGMCRLHMDVLCRYIGKTYEGFSSLQTCNNKDVVSLTSLIT